jgi:hypothetical protein
MGLSFFSQWTELPLHRGFNSWPPDLELGALTKWLASRMLVCVSAGFTLPRVYKTKLMSKRIVLTRKHFFITLLQGPTLNSAHIGDAAANYLWSKKMHTDSLASMLFPSFMLFLTPMLLKVFLLLVSPTIASWRPSISILLQADHLQVRLQYFVHLRIWVDWSSRILSWVCNTYDPVKLVYCFAIQQRIAITWKLK